VKLRRRLYLQNTLPQSINTIQKTSPLIIYKIDGIDFMEGITMMKKAISCGIVGLFVLSGLVGIFFMVPYDVEAPGPTYVSGIISTNINWTVANSPYIVVGNILVESGATLAIEPGVEVRFDDYYYLWIDGELNSAGTETEMITFTSNKSTPDKADWDGIKIFNNMNNAVNVIKYTTIKYGFDAIRIELPNSSNDISVNVITME
jgi:hypothetical protein